jgi:hypothetical protein
MLKVPSLILPATLPTQRAIRSFGDNERSYEPEFWEFQYECYRYLGRVELSALVERYRALIRNMMALVAPERDIIPIASFLSSWYWFRKEHQTRLEFSMRGVEAPVKPPTEPIHRMARSVPARPSSPNAGDVIFRYARRKWIEEMVYQGRVRISPAAFYGTLKADAARSDEERAKSRFMPGEYSQIMTSDGRQQPFIGDVRSIISAPNYYCLSFAGEFDSALFGDFGADACAVIRDGDMFAERLEVAGKTELGDWYFHHNPVQYFDPYERRRDEYFDPRMSKDFRFAYQREYRFLWAHPGGEEPGDFKALTLGSLQDIAEIHPA